VRVTTVHQILVAANKVKNLRNLIVGAKYSHSSPVGAANIPVIPVVPIISSAFRSFQLFGRSSFLSFQFSGSFGFGGCSNHLGFQVVPVLGHNLLIMLF
jgi:hypothetical protein